MNKSKKIGIIIGCLAILVLGIVIISQDKTKTVEKTTAKVEETPVDSLASGAIESSGEKLNVSIGSGSGSEGDDIIIPMTFDDACKGGVDACDFKIMYDPNVLEATSVTYGDIVVAGDESFTSETDSSKGIISFLFMDNTSGKQAIKEKGIFSNITFKVKKDAAKGNTTVSLKSIGAFVDEVFREHEVTFKDGSINVK